MALTDFPAPVQKVTEQYDIELPESAFKIWRFNSQWRKMGQKAEEFNLSETKMKLLECVNIYIFHTKTSVIEKGCAYYVAARYISYLDEDIVLRWIDQFEDFFDYKESHRKGTSPVCKEYHFTEEFIGYVRVFGSVDEWAHTDAVERVNAVTNIIRLSEPKNIHNGKPLIVEKVMIDGLLPHFKLENEMTDEEVKIASAMLKLLDSWRVNKEDERLKMYRFVSVYVDSIDEIVEIVRTRYVDSLDHLQTIFESSASKALADGIL